MFLVSHEKLEDLAMQNLGSYMAKPAGNNGCFLPLLHQGYTFLLATVPTGPPSYIYVSDLSSALVCDLRDFRLVISDAFLSSQKVCNSQWANQ